MVKYFNNEQEQEINRICQELHKKGYKYKLSNNLTENGVCIDIEPNIQIEGCIVIFDNGNWIKDIYLKNTSLYRNGTIEIYESLLKYDIYKISGSLPLNI